MRRIAVFKLWLRCQCDVLQGSKERYGRRLITLTRSVAALLAGMLRMWCMAVLGLTASHRPSEAMTMRAPFSGSVTCRTSGSDVTAEPACEKATCQDLHSLFVSYKLWLLSECDNQPHQFRQQIGYAACTFDSCALLFGMTFQGQRQLYACSCSSQELQTTALLSGSLAVIQAQMHGVSQ